MKRHKLSLKRENISQPSTSKQCFAEEVDKDDDCFMECISSEEKPIANVMDDALPIMEQHSADTNDFENGSNTLQLQESSDSDFLAAVESREKNCCLCGKLLGASDSDHWKLCIQQFKKDSSLKQDVQDTDSNDSFRCTVCQKNLSHMNALAKNQHINKCLAKDCDVSLQNPSFSCPFCRKVLEIKSRVSHLKLCGKRSGYGSADVMNVLVLLKRQEEERQAAGLPPEMLKKPQKRLKRTNTNSVNFIPESKQEADLQMALALSSSLQEEKQQMLEMENEYLGIFNEPNAFNMLMDAPKENKKKNQKKISDGKYLLLLRSDADRQQLVQQRVAAVLCDDCPQIIDSCMSPSSCASISNLLTPGPSCRKPDNILWNLSSLSCAEANDITNFYVKSLKTVLTPCKVKPGTKFFRFSQIPGRLATQAVVQNIAKHDFIDNEENILEVTDFLMDEQPNEHKSITINNDSVVKSAAIPDFISCSPDSSDEYSNGKHNSKQELEDYVHFSTFFSCSYLESAESLVDDLDTLVGRNDASDVQIQTKDSLLPGHSVLFYIRCPKLYEEISKVKSKAGSNPVVIDWSNVTLTTALEFLRFIYTGRLSDALISRNEMAHLIDKYELQPFVNNSAKLENVTDHKVFTSLQVPDVLNSNYRLVMPSDKVDLDENHDLRHSCIGSSPNKRLFNSTVNSKAAAVTSLGNVNTSVNILDDTIDEHTLELNVKKRSQNETSPCFPSQYRTQRSNDETKPDFESVHEPIDVENKVKSPEKVEGFLSPFPLHRLDYNPETSTSTPISHFRKKNHIPKRFSVSTIKSVSDHVSESDSNVSSSVTGRNVQSCVSETNFTHQISDPTFSPVVGNNVPSQNCADIINISSDHEVFEESGNVKYENSNDHPSKKSLIQDLNTFSKSAIYTNKSAIDMDGAVSPILIASPVASLSDEDLESNKDAEYPFSPVCERKNFSLLDNGIQINESLQNVSANECQSVAIQEHFEDGGCGDDTFLLLCKDIPTCIIEPSVSLATTNLNQNEITKAIPTTSKHADCEKGLLQKEGSAPKQVKTKFQKQKKKKVKKQDASPMPDFDGMNTPHLQVQLKKIGVRQQKRKHAVKILQHVYHGTHPLVTESEQETSIDETAHSPKQKRTKTGKTLVLPKTLTTTQEDVLNSSQSSSFSTSSINSNESSFLEESIFNSPEKGKISSDVEGSLATKFHNFITSDRQLHIKILTYEPLDFEKLHKEMVEARIKHTKCSLMDYLDEQGITFTMRNNHTKKRGSRLKIAVTKTKS